MVELIDEDQLAHRVAVHTALADTTRLRVVDLLALSDRSPSELATELGVGSNLLAHHLAILEAAGLIERLPSSGDGRRRYLRLVPQIVGGPSLDAPDLVAGTVLFVCTGNSARSQIAAAIWNRLGDVPATSAGTHPAPRVDPLAVDAAARAGLDIAGARPTSIEDVSGRPDLIVTVCDRAHEEMWAMGGGTASLHWSIPDPREIGEPAAFDAAVRRLSERIAVVGPHVTPKLRRRRETARMEVSRGLTGGE